jgi:hypothetical protein
MLDMLELREVLGPVFPVPSTCAQGQHISKKSHHCSSAFAASDTFKSNDDIGSESAQEPGPTRRTYAFTWPAISWEGYCGASLWV